MILFSIKLRKLKREQAASVGNSSSESTTNATFILVETIMWIINY